MLSRSHIAMGLTPRILLLASLMAINACGGDDPTGPLPDAEGVRLVVAPGALLFAAPGEQQQLRA